MEELIIKDREFKEKLTQLINESGLPAFILKPTFKEIFEQLNLLEQQQYQQSIGNSNKEDKEVKDDKLDR